MQTQNLSLQKEICDRKRAEEAVTVFLHAVSHDLRNPVTGMLMVLQNLLNTSSEKIVLPRPTIERMIQSNERQLSLINSLLEAHVNDIQEMVLHPQAMAVTELVQNAINDLTPLAAKENTAIANLVGNDLPLVHVDSNQVCRIFQNLISNSIKHNPPGLQIAISATVTEENWMRCTVQDNGVGIPAEQCEHLFELYAQGKHHRRSLGLGLGLYICRQIVRAHGGEIGVASELNAGSQFWFTLPLTAPSPEDDKKL
jgi:two-component system sensor histidine kinase/response regulator